MPRLVRRWALLLLSCRVILAPGKVSHPQRCSWAPPHSCQASPWLGEGCCVPQVPQAMSPCHAAYGRLLSNSNWGWQLNPGGTLPAFPLQHRHRARLPCTRPLPAAPHPHHSPGARRHPALNSMPGDTAGRGFAGRGTGKTWAHSTQAVAGEAGSRWDHSRRRKGSWGQRADSAMERMWRRHGRFP